MHAHARVHACAHHSSTASQGCESVHYMYECVCCYSFANSSTVSVCQPVHAHPCVFPLQYEFALKGETQSHTHTSTHIMVLSDSPHLCHILESVGRHRRDTLRRKMQETTFRGAGARAHERRTGIVAAEGAVAKGFCPWYGRARDGAFVTDQCAHLLDTDRRALQLVVGQLKASVSRRNTELGRHL
jgi:hypothetical protein